MTKESVKERLGDVIGVDARLNPCGSCVACLADRRTITPCHSITTPNSVQRTNERRLGPCLYELIKNLGVGVIVGVQALMRRACSTAI
jgi:hypothetical protein